MEIRYEKHWSGWLNRDMEFKIYGSCGKPVIFIPCQAGRFWDFESFKMVDYWAPWIESGKCMGFSIDTIDNESWAAIGADNRWRIENHEKWYHYVVDELVPYIRHVAGMANGHDQGIMTFGASMGAMHAANFYYRRPDLFASCFAISGLYDNKEFFGAYCDELSLFPEDFFAMLLSRLSVSGAKLIATTNPDNPGHWLKRNYLDNDALDLLDLKFTLDDNPFLPSEYVRALKTEYTGVFYDRFILGNWTAAEGRIYEDFSQKCEISPQELRQRLSESPLTTSVIGVDYGGNKSASAFVHTGFDAGFSNVYVLSEHYDKRNVSAESLSSAFADFVTQERERFPTLEMACCDSAEQLLIKSFRSAVSLEVRNAMKKPVSTRINMVHRLISAGRLHFSSECPHLIEALKTAVWDDKSLHNDVRLDDGSTNIDSLDAFEYSLERFERELFRY